MTRELPPSFDDAWFDEWCLWVLDNGLVALPDVLLVGESVPVARWSGRRFGAVLQVQWDEDSVAPGTEVQTYGRTDTGWEAAAGSGGGGWFDPPLARPAVSATIAEVFHFHASGGGEPVGWGCCAAYGVAGAAAAWVEVVDADGTSRAAVESSLGVFVVAADRASSALVRILQADGTVMCEVPFSPEADWHTRRPRR